MNILSLRLPSDNFTLGISSFIYSSHMRRYQVIPISLEHNNFLVLGIQKTRFSTAIDYHGINVGWKTTYTIVGFVEIAFSSCMFFPSKEEHSSTLQEVFSDALADRIASRSIRNIISLSFRDSDMVKALEVVPKINVMFNEFKSDVVRVHSPLLIMNEVIIMKEVKQIAVQQLVTRAAFDVGSGETKFTIADVDQSTNRIVTLRHQCVKPLLLRQDLASSAMGCLSEAIEEELIATILSIKEEVHEILPNEWSAVGTSVFRKAKNSQEFLNRVEMATDIAIRIIPQDEEGEIGFASAVAASKELPENIISWDSGSGSFQLSSLVNGKLEIYGAEFGFVPTLEALFALRKQTFDAKISPNPVRECEVLELVKVIRSKLPPKPIWMANHNKKVVGIGGREGSFFHIGTIATNRSFFTKEEVMGSIQHLCGKSDAELQCEFIVPEHVLIVLSLMYTIMDHCGLEKVGYFRTNGNSEGLLITSRFWK